MENESLYKRHRPKSFERMVGCTGTAQTLAAMLEKGTLPHVIAFTGPPGTGKTTMARIVKDELKCHDLDYQEMNSGSFRGIDSIREVQRLMYLCPAAGPVRIWLFDEVHMWTSAAQNAALKILEDTPPHVYFMLATTDPEKLITAIRTRCCEMPTRALTTGELSDLCRRVAKKEKLAISDRTVDTLADAAQGSARTALVLLDKIANLDEADREAAIESALAEQNEAYDLCKALIKKGTSFGTVAKLLMNMKGEPEAIRYSVLGYARGALLRSGDIQAYNVIVAFSNNFYDSKQAGLAAACYEATNPPR